MEYTDRNDTFLATAACNGDDRALRMLIERYLRPVHRFAQRMGMRADDADDVTQQSFVKMWKNLSSYDANRTFSTWLFAIAHNEAVNWLKKKRPEALTPEIEDSLADPVRPTDTLALESALIHLEPGVRTVVEQHAFHGYTFRELSTAMGQPLHTVKSRYRRALASLKKLLGNR